MSTFNPFADPIVPRDSALPSRVHSMRRNAPSVTGASVRKAKGAS